MKPWQWIALAVGAYLITRSSGASAMTDQGKPTVLPAPSEPQKAAAGSAPALPTRVEPFIWRAIPPAYTAADLAVIAHQLPRGQYGHDDYIQALYDQQAKHLPALKAHYDRDKLRAITRAAASYFSVPPEWVWGTLYGESKQQPVGVYGHSAQKAQDVAGGQGSNAYGMSQMLGSRYDGEKKARPKFLWWSHSDLLSPPLAIWATASSFGRALSKYGGGPGVTGPKASEAARRFAATANGYGVGAWWASPGRDSAGARKKVGHIATRGADVFAGAGNPAAGLLALPTAPGAAIVA